MFDTLYEHTDQVEMFRRSLQRGRLSHAYLLVGPSGIGKMKFGRLVATSLFCSQFDDDDLNACGECDNCRRMLAKTYPDYIEVGCPEGKSEIPIEAFVGTIDRRGREGLCHDLSLKPMAGQRKVAIINDAECMNAASTNSLLKTLEEPPNGSLIMLVATNADAVLPTIRSRCQIIRFNRLTDATIARLLVEQQMVETSDEAEVVARLCGGSLATATQLLDPAIRSLRTGLYTSLADGPKMRPMSLSKQLLEGIDEIGGDSNAQRTNAGWLIRFAVEFYRQSLRLLGDETTATEIPQVRAFVEGLVSSKYDSSEVCMALLERCMETQTHINMKAPLPLCVETLTQKLGAILRANHS